MSLATRCPHCNTLFKVSAGQLQLHDGNVRCGSCQGVFSGIEHLAPADSTVWENMHIDSNLESNFDANASAPHHASAANESPNSAELETLSVLTEQQPPLWQRGYQACQIHWKTLQRPQQWGLLGLTVLLMLQMLWLSRVSLVQPFTGLSTTIGQSGPTLRSWFALPASQALIVEGSGLQKLDDQRIELEITLKNIQHLPARWPWIHVTLKDENEQALSSILLKPDQYTVRQTKTQPNTSPILGGTRLEIQAWLNTSKLIKQLPESAAESFQIELFDDGPQFAESR